MSTSPIPPRRLNVSSNGRSRSPSPAANSNTTLARNNFLDPENSELFRTRRGVPTDSDNKEDTRLPESIPLIDREIATQPYSGVDGFFLSDRNNPDGSSTVPGTNGVAGATEGGDAADGGRRVFPARDPFSPTDLDGKPRFPDFELGTIPDLESIPDVNVYQHKKTLAQGMMDLALFSANANQLRYVLESNQHPYYYPGIVLISISLIFQVAIGVGLIWNSRYNVKDKKEICIANKISNFTIIGIFMVTVVNVFISAFGVASVQPVVRPP